MDIAAMSIGLHQASTQNLVQLSVMKMAMNSEKSNCDETVNMINNMAVEPYKGEHIDTTV